MLFPQPFSPDTLGATAAFKPIQGCLALLTLLLCTQALAEPTTIFAGPHTPTGPEISASLQQHKLSADSLKVCIEPVKLNSGFNAARGEAPKVLKAAVVAAAAAIGYQVEFVEQPWLRCLFMVKNNLLDGLIATVWQAERNAWMQFPLTAEGTLDNNRRVWRSDYPIYVAKGSTLNWDGQNFSGIQNGIGCPLGYHLATQLKSLGVLKSGVNTTTEGLAQVAQGSLDAFITEASIAQAHIEALGLKGQLQPLPEVFTTKDVFIPLSHQFYTNNTKAAEQFFTHLAEQYRLRE